MLTYEKNNWNAEDLPENHLQHPPVNYLLIGKAHDKPRLSCRQHLFQTFFKKELSPLLRV